MRRRNNHSHDLRGEPRQIDLFAPVSLGGATGTPGWIDLPAQTRKALTRLMIRLILDHTHKDRARCWKEMGQAAIRAMREAARGAIRLVVVGGRQSPLESRSDDEDFSTGGSF